MIKLPVKVLRGHLLTILVLALTAFVVNGCCYDSYGVGMAWEDTNCNGVKDPGEPPMSGVCVWTSGYADVATPSPEECVSESLQTDSEGFGNWIFYSGAACKDVFVFAQAPDGYSATTYTVANGCEGKFGFAPEGTCPPHESITARELVARANSPFWARVFAVLCVLLVLAFGYWMFRRRAVGGQESSSEE
jgi:hypothetical protein